MSTAPAAEKASKNHLLAALPADEFDRVISKLQSVTLTLGQVLYESGDKLEYVYFPTTAIISLLYIMENGATAEIGMVGNDGILGIALFMGGDTTPNRAIIQSADEALKMSARDLKAEFTLGGVFHNLLLRYTQALITQISQTAVCNRLHPIEQQLCRWLLLSHDRLDSDKLVMTHDLISNMLGAPRRRHHRRAKACRTRPHPQRPRHHHGPRPPPHRGRRLRMLQSRQRRIPPAAWIEPRSGREEVPLCPMDYKGRR